MFELQHKNDIKKPLKRIKLQADLTTEELDSINSLSSASDSRFGSEPYYYDKPNIPFNPVEEPNSPSSVAPEINNDNNESADEKVETKPIDQNVSEGQVTDDNPANEKNLENEKKPDTNNVVQPDDFEDTNDAQVPSSDSSTSGPIDQINENENVNDKKVDENNSNDVSIVESSTQSITHPEGTTEGSGVIEISTEAAPYIPSQDSESSPNVETSTTEENRVPENNGPIEETPKKSDDDLNVPTTDVKPDATVPKSDLPSQEYLPLPESTTTEENVSPNLNYLPADDVKGDSFDGYDYPKPVKRMILPKFQLLRNYR